MPFLICVDHVCCRCYFQMLADCILCETLPSYEVEFFDSFEEG